MKNRKKSVVVPDEAQALVMYIIVFTRGSTS